MNKTAIKNFAIQSRVELIQGVTQKAFELGITQENILNNTITSSDTFVVHGKVLDATKKRQREEVIHQIQLKGFSQLIEEVAYTWFNRLIALRFMEVNQYLPSGIRVFTNHINEFKPELLDQALNLTFKDMDRNKVLDYLDQHQEEALYQYLLILQCNEMNRYLPEMFEKIDNYTEVLLPDGLLRRNGVIGNMISMIDESDWKDQVQIIGWLYQYYISEKHDQVVDVLRGVAVKKEDIPAATQLFTPDWIVRYMVENSLGRLWVEGHPNPSLQSNWKYYVEEAQEEAEVEQQLQQIREEYKTLKPEDIKVIDPCMGSGHILVYAFDVLMQIYLSVGYLESDAAKLILEKNLYGLDIDRRAYQLAYFSLMMKARKYNTRLLLSGVKPQLYEPTGYPDGLEYGSLINVDKLEPAPEAPQSVSLFDESYETKLNVWNFRRLLSQKYDVVVTNPPYLRKLNSKLKNFVNSEYRDYNGDLFSVFIYRNLQMCKSGGFSAYMTPNVWMFIKSYEKLRNYILENKSVASLIQLAKGAFYKEATVDVCAFVLCNSKQFKKGVFVRLDDFRADMETQNQKLLEVLVANEKHIYHIDPIRFYEIEGKPFAYWISDKTRSTFKSHDTIGTLSTPKPGLSTADNDRFLRRWYEVKIDSIGFNYGSTIEAKNSGKKWFPYNKGGSYRRWYGNREYLVNWENDGAEIKSFKDFNGNLRSRPQNLKYFFKQGITWSDTTSASFSGRFSEKGFLFDIKGSSGFPNDYHIRYILGLLNSGVSQEFIRILNPTITTQVGDMARIPAIIDKKFKILVDHSVNVNISISQEDWDSFETSWDFAKHPFLTHKPSQSNKPVSLIQDSFNSWSSFAEKQFYQLKANEEELNRIFIDIYGLQDELTPEVEEKDVTVRKADLTRDMKSFISYIVGCVFGRYSLDEEGLIYAGGEWNDSRYSTFKPVKDNIIVVNEDIFDEHSLLGKVIEFVKVVYGEVTLEENLSFIASALGTSGQSAREKIAKYLLSDFYQDHVKTYQKRPIYWLFDSGKANGFKALIYLHRYSSETLVKLRLDYVHPTQDGLRGEILAVSRELERTSDARLKAKYVTQLKDLKDKADEVLKYEQKLHHLVDKKIVLDLDDGVVVNYAKFEDLVVKIK